PGRPRRRGETDDDGERGTQRGGDTHVCHTERTDFAARSTQNRPAATNTAAAAMHPSPYTDLVRNSSAAPSPAENSIKVATGNTAISRAVVRTEARCVYASRRTPASARSESATVTRTADSPAPVRSDTSHAAATATSASAPGWCALARTAAAGSPPTIAR